MTTIMTGRFPRGLVLPSLLVLARQAAAQQNQPGNPTSTAILSSPTLKIALIAAGSGIVVIIILIIACCCIRSRKKKKKQSSEVQTPLVGSFNPDALPANPVPTRPEVVATTATFHAPSSSQASQGDRLPFNPMPSNSYHHEPTPTALENAYTPDYYHEPYRATQDPTPNMPPQYQANVPAKLRIGQTPHPPSGIGFEGMVQPAGRTGGWAAVEQSQAWGMHGRHIDQEGQYYGSVAQQGGQGPAPARGLRQPGVRAAYPRQPPAPAAVYGANGSYAQRTHASGHRRADKSEDYGVAGNPYSQPAPTSRSQYSPSYNTHPQTTPYASNQDRYAGNATQQRGYTGASDPYQTRQPQQPRSQRQYPQRQEHEEQEVGGYGDYGAGQYGHTRDESAESDRSYHNYASYRPTAPNRFV